MYTKDGFYKALEQKLGDDAYILLAGGGTKKLADLLTAASLTADGNSTKLSITVGGTTKTSSVTVPYATNADKVDGIHANGLLTAASLGASGNSTTISVTVGGTTKSGSVTVPYATNADTVDGYHANNFVYNSHSIFVSQYNQGLWMRFLTLTNIRNLGGTITFMWHPEECTRAMFSIFNINFRSNDIVFFETRFGSESRTLKVTGDGTTFYVWVKASSKASYDPFGAIQHLHAKGLSYSYYAPTGFTDTEPSGTYSKIATCSNYAASAGSVAWGNVTGKPSTFTPASHTHSYLPLSGGTLTGLLYFNQHGLGTTYIGHANSSWMHFESPVPFYFSTSVAVNGDLYPYSNISKSLGTSSNYWLNGYIACLQIGSNRYNAYDGGTYGINLNNSDIIGVNSILTSDLSENWKESIGFKRTNGNYDTFRAADGTFYFGVNNGTEYTAIHSGNYTSYTVTKTGGGASGTWGINVTGSAGSVAWGNVTSKPGSTGSGTQPVYWNGSTFVACTTYANASVNYANTAYQLSNVASVDGGNTSTYLWRRIAFSGERTSNWNDCDALILIKHNYNGGRFGLLKISFRTDNIVDGANASASAIWLARSGFTSDSVKIALYKVKGKAYADIYLNVGTYPRCTIHTLKTSGWTFYSSNEGANSTNPVNAYTSIESAATTIHGVAYTSITNSSDGATVSYANSAGNADTVDSQHFKWSNDSNSPTYLWAANSSGTAFLCARGSMSVNYANSAGSASSATTSTILLTNNTSQAADSCYTGAPGLRFWRYNGTSSTTGQGGGDGWILSWSWNNGSVGGQIYLDDNPSKTMCIRGCNGSDSNGSPTGGFTTWATMLHSDNYTSYTVTKTGSGASGTWGINVTGSASSANYLSTYAADGDNNLKCLQNIFNSLPKSVATAVRLQHGSHSMAIGWFLSGYGYSNAYGGWFISDYGNPVWVGVDNGSWNTCNFITSNNIGSQSVSYANSAGSATTASQVKDAGNGTVITFKYSTGGFTSNPTWLGAWNGYQLTYVSPSVLSVNYASSTGNSDTVDSYHANRFAFTYCSANYGASSSVTVNDLVTNGVSNASHGMIYAATDNPVGTSNWVHVWSQQWTIGTTSSWVSQIALGVQQGTGMWYRTYSGNIVGRGWTRVLDSSNYTSYTISRTGDDITGHFTVRGRIFGYNYNNQGSNAVAFMWDKPGSYYTGMGPNGVTNQIHFGPCNADGTWVSGFSQQWDFQGNVYASNFYVSSDRTKKTNIEILSDHIRKFTLKETNKDAYGVIAQEVPEMFRDGEEGNMTVNYNSILSYYVGLLENRVKDLEETNKKLLEFIEKIYGKII